MMPHLRAAKGNVYRFSDGTERVVYDDTRLPDGAELVRDPVFDESGHPALTAKGKPRTCPRKVRSEPSLFLEQGQAPVYALIDYVARVVHAERGLSPGVNNARFIHAGQATQWGREQEDRSDITDVTTEGVYPQPVPPDLSRPASFGFGSLS